MHCILDHCKWISANDGTPCRVSVTASAGRTYALYLACTGSYAVSLGGETIWCGEIFSPQSFRYYHKIDLTDVLAEGENDLLICSASALCFAVTEDGRTVAASGEGTADAAVWQKHPASPRTLGVRLPARLSAWGTYQTDGNGGGRAYFSDPAEAAPILTADGIVLSAEEADGDGIWFTVSFDGYAVGYPDVEIALPTACDLRIGDGVYSARAGKNHVFDPLKCVESREMRILVPAKSVTVGYVGLRSVRYPFDRTSYFTCSDQLHNRIYAACAKRLEQGMLMGTDEFTPEPALRNRFLGAYCTVYERAMPRAALRAMAARIRAEEITDSISLGRFVILLYEYGFYSGNVALAAELLDLPKRIIEVLLARRDARGLLDADAAEPNLLLSSALAAMAGICRMVSQEKEATEYLTLRSTLNPVIDSAFRLCGAADGYADVGASMPDQYLSALAVLCGVCPEERIDSVLASIAGEACTAADLVHRIYVYDALMLRAEAYAQTVLDEIAAIWGERIFSDKLSPADAAVPVYVYFRYVAGICLVGDGRLRCTRKPVPCGIHTFEAVMQTARRSYRSDSTMFART